MGGIFDISAWKCTVLEGYLRNFSLFIAGRKVGSWGTEARGEKLSLYNFPIMTM